VTDQQDGLVAQDMDGDGRILMMRIEDPNGTWKVSTVDRRLLVPREPIERDNGPYYRLLTVGEIQNSDRARIKRAPALAVLDMNRNYPIEWRPDVLRSERGYIEHVVANLRPWREYEASVNRLWKLEDEAREPGFPAPPRFPPALEWWVENFSLVRDLHRRRWSGLLQTYPQVLADPERFIARALKAIGSGDLAKAVAAVKPENRTQRVVTSDSIEPELAIAFDDLYGAVEEGRIGDTLVDHLEATHRKLVPRLRKLQTDMAEQMWSLGLRPPPPYILGVPRA
jgi:hypothetical protein